MQPKGLWQGWSASCKRFTCNAFCRQLRSGTFDAWEEQSANIKRTNHKIESSTIMKKELLITATVALAVAGNAWADDANADHDHDRSLRYDDPASVYRGNEFSLEAFGTDAISQY